MGKRQDWSVATCVFLFLSLASQISCTRQVNELRRVPSQKEKDLIKKLPGQPPVSFKQYGGYVAVDEKATRFFYYYFVEAINATKSTPLVIWFNGGPACSSLGGGAFNEIGPFRVQSDGKKLFRNPYSWNNEANLLFLETPAGVGFSYSTTPIDAAKFGAEGDRLTAEDNYKFLVNWLERFPEFKGREVHITGQSYAGHYVPQLSQIILNRNNQTFINLRGIMLGSPGLEFNDLEEHSRQFMVTHGLVSQEIMDKRNKHCNFEGFSEYGNNNLDECFVWEEKINHITKHLDTYNINAPLCLNSTSRSTPKNKCTTIMDVDPCSANYVKAYLNSNKVQKAIHANTTKLPYAWVGCNKELFDKWSDDKFIPMAPILQELMDKGVRIMLYNGDLDMQVTFNATRAVVKSMNLKVVKEWRSWVTQGQVGGYTEDYSGNLTFATVKGAGHDMPKDQPIHALNLFTSFIRNTPLPEGLKLPEF